MYAKPSVLDVSFERNMFLRWLSFIVLLSCLIYSSKADNSSLTILFPGTLFTNKPEFVTCIFHNYGEVCQPLIQIVVSLEGNLSNIIYNETYDLSKDVNANGKRIRQNPLKHNTQMVFLDIALPNLNSTATHTALVLITVDSVKPKINYTFGREVFVKKTKEKLLFIETDKDVYRPGEKIIIRLLSLNMNFLPIPNEKATVWIDTPSDIRIFKWIDLDISSGVIQFDDILPKSTEIGFYRIGLNCGDDQLIDVFEVSSYVKHRFEVLVKPNHAIYATDKSANFTVCANYLHGHFIHGIANISIYRQMRKNSTLIDNFAINITEGKGCEQFTVNLIPFKMKTLDLYRVKRLVNVKVTEESTGIEISTSHEIAVTLLPYRIQFLDTANPTIKPGIPYKAALQLESTFDLEPVVGEVIEVCAVYEKRSYAQNAKNVLTFKKCRNFTSNNEGRVYITFPCRSPDHKRAWIKAKAVKYQNKYIANSKNKAMPYLIQPKAERFFNSWFSPSSHYLQLAPIYDDIPCNDNVSFNFYYLRSSTSKTFHLNYIVTCQNLLSVYGSQDLIYNSSDVITNNTDDTFLATNTTRDKGSFNDFPQYLLKGKLSVPNLRENYLHPGCSIFVFYFKSDNEMVGDTQRFKMKDCFKNDIKLTVPTGNVKQGEKSELEIEATGSSLCMVSAVDEKVEALKELKHISLRSQITSFDDHSWYLSKTPVPYIEDFYRCQNYTLKMMEKPFIHFLTTGLKRGKREFNEYTPPEAPNREMVMDMRDAFSEFSSVYMTDAARKIETRSCLDSELDVSVDITGQMITILNSLEFEFADNSTIIRRKELHSKFKPPQRRDVNYLVHGTINSNELSTSLIRGRKRITSNFEQQDVWFYRLVSLKDDGKVKLRYKVPYSVSNWKFNVICINKTNGISVSEQKVVHSNPKLYVSSFFPKKAKRNETVKLRYFVHTEYSSCVPVSIKIIESNSSEFIIINETKKTICSCSEKLSEVNFNVRPFIYSNIDLTVIAKVSNKHWNVCNGTGSDVEEETIKYDEKLIVESKGVRAQFVRTIYICPNESQSTASFQLKFTNTTVNNSLQAFILASGDLFSRYCIENDYFTLSLPRYAGEPNLLRVWKSYLALNYNEFVNFTFFGRPEKSVIINTLQKAHKHQIAFRKPDGSFTQFILSKVNKKKKRRDNQEESSLFISAYSLKSLAMIKKYIFVDFEALNETLGWILSLQDLKTGCWNPIGPVINHHLQNNETKTSLMTAFVLIALLESQTWLSAPSNEDIDLGFQCLKNNTKEDAYSLVLTAYVHALANRSEANDYLKKLLPLAQNDVIELLSDAENVTFWEQEVPGEQWISKSTSIQVAAYYVLTVLKLKEDKNSTKLCNVVKWLVAQQNTFGGYQSSFDTSVALQALYEISVLKFTEDYNQKLTIIDDKDEIAYTAHINNKTRFLLNTKQLGKLPQHLTVNSEGKGCIYIQVEEFFFKTRLNTKSVSPFSLSVETHRNTANKCKLLNIVIDLNFEAANESNMVIVEVSLVTGVEPSLQSLDELVRNDNNSIVKYDRSLDKLFIYLRSLIRGENVSIEFEMVEYLEVFNRKPAIVRVYDYYDNNMKTELNYNIPNTSECGQSRNYSQPAMFEAKNVKKFFGQSMINKVDKDVIEEYYLGNKELNITERRDFLYVIHDEDKYNGRFDLTADSSD